MQKSIIRKQVSEKLRQLKNSLQQLDVDSTHTHAEMTALQQQLQETLRLITIYEYILGQSEIAPDLNVHFKVMQEAEKKEHKPVDEKQTLKPAEEIIKAEPKKIEPVKTEEKQIVPPVAENTKRPGKKMEISINDKFRMINELFQQNQNEYNIAIEQLNAVGTPEEATTYINGLAGVYNWDEEKDIVKTLKRLALKRFS